MKLCPIRAVKIYLKRTKSIRKGRDRLFIYPRGGIMTYISLRSRNGLNSQLRMLTIAFQVVKADYLKSSLMN